MAPHNFWPGLFVALSGLYICIYRAKTPKAAALFGCIFSLGYFGLSLSWVANALLVEGNPYWWAWPLAISGLPIILAPFTAAACAIYKIICKNNNSITSFLIFCLCLSIAEFARGHLFTGFPWNLYGYAWIDVLPIAQLASLHNIYLLSTLTVFWAVAPGFILTWQERKHYKNLFSLIIVTSIACGYIYGTKRLHSTHTTNLQSTAVIVVQPNIQQSEKWKAEKRVDNFLQLIQGSVYNAEEYSDAVKNHIIVWPETAISQDLLDSLWVKEQISKTLSGYPNNAYLVSGALRYTRATDSYNNSILTIDNAGEIISIYDKRHLVPFGEYMPFSNIINIAPIVGFTGFEKGAKESTQSIPSGLSFNALVCYEIIFPSYAQSPKNTPTDIIINVTNDAWYGESAGPYQHLVQTQFRAIETGSPVVRSANTGISAIISSQGVVLQSKPLNESGTLYAPL